MRRACGDLLRRRGRRRRLALLPHRGVRWAKQRNGSAFTIDWLPKLLLGISCVKRARLVATTVRAARCPTRTALQHSRAASQLCACASRSMDFSCVATRDMEAVSAEHFGGLHGSCRALRRLSAMSSSSYAVWSSSFRRPAPALPLEVAPLRTNYSRSLTSSRGQQNADAAPRRGLEEVPEIGSELQD